MVWSHKKLESQSEVDSIAKLTEGISDLSCYLLQEHFIFTLELYSNQVKSVLSFQNHPAQLCSVAVHSSSEKQTFVLSKMQEKG